MNCPHCGHGQTRVTDTQDKSDAVVRHRLCRGCARSFATTETINSIGGERVDPLPRSAATQRTASQRYRPADPSDVPKTVTATAAEFLLLWWNESRWSKHRQGAVWTRFAFQQSATRLGMLSDSQQRTLAMEAAECGWMAIKPDYLKTSDATERDAAHAEMEASLRG